MKADKHPLAAFWYGRLVERLARMAKPKPQKRSRTGKNGCRAENGCHARPAQLQIRSLRVGSSCSCPANQSFHLFPEFPQFDRVRLAVIGRDPKTISTHIAAVINQKQEITESKLRMRQGTRSKPAFQSARLAGMGADGSGRTAEREPVAPESQAGFEAGRPAGTGSGIAIRGSAERQMVWGAQLAITGGATWLRELLKPLHERVREIEAACTGPLPKGLGRLPMSAFLDTADRTKVSTKRLATKNFGRIMIYYDTN